MLTHWVLCLSKGMPARDGHVWSCHSLLLAWDRTDNTGCLAQDDLLYESLTVYETLYFAAMLRLPSSMTRAQKVARVADVIQSLGLGRCKDTIIGAPAFGEEASAGVGGFATCYSCSCNVRLQLLQVQLAATPRSAMSAWTHRACVCRWV